MEGFSGIASAPIEGERVQTFVRIVGPPSSSMSPHAVRRGGIVGYCRAVTPTCFNVTRAGLVEDDSAPRTHFAGRVFTDEDRGAQVAAALLPTVLAPGTGMSSSIVCARSTSLPAAHSLSDVGARKCLAINFLEGLLDDCSKRQLTCYLSMGVFDRGEVFDIFASEFVHKHSLRPIPARVEVNLLQRSLFPEMHEVGVTSKRVNDIVIAGLREIVRFRSCSSIRSDADIFFVLNIEHADAKQPSSPRWNSRLTLIDLGDPSRLQQLQLTDKQQVEIDFGGAILPLLAYGVALTSRCSFLLSVPSSLAAGDVQLLSLLTSIGAIVSFPTSSPPIGSVPPHEALRAQLEVILQLRKKLNGGTESAPNSKSSAASHEEEMAEAQTEIAALRGLLAEKLPLRFELDSHPKQLLKIHVETIRRVQEEQAATRRRLQEYEEWLLSLPVADRKPLGPSISGGTEFALKEQALVALKEENARMKRLFVRDIALLKSELSVAQQVANMRTPLPSPFYSVVEGFFEDAALVVANRDGTSLQKMGALIDSLCTSLHWSARLFLEDSSAPSRTTPSVDASRLIFEAAVEKMRRLFGISVGVPQNQSSPTMKYFEELVLGQFACRTERYRLRATCETLLLLVDRMGRIAEDLASNLDKFCASSSSAQRVAAPESPAKDGHALLLAEASSLLSTSPGRSRSQSVMSAVGVTQLNLRQAVVPLLHTLEKFQAVIAALRDLGRGISHDSMDVEDLGVVSCITDRYFGRETQESPSRPLDQSLDSTVGASLVPASTSAKSIVKAVSSTSPLVVAAPVEEVHIQLDDAAVDEDFEEKKAVGIRTTPLSAVIPHGLFSRMKKPKAAKAKGK